MIGTDESVRKIDFFEKLKFEKIGDIFAINYSEKNRTISRLQKIR